MAINKKLIHFDMTKQLFMSNANGLNNLTKPTNGIVGNIPYYSVVFLKDGYIWTHGHFINGTGIADSVSSNATISWSKITDKPSTFTPSAHTQAYTTLTGSGTTANQAIVSSGTANGWVLKTLGSRAFDSTNYLPLAGGTMNAGAMIVWQDWGQWGASSSTYPKANGGLQWSGTSDWIKLFAEETAPDDLRLILQCGDDTSPQFNIRNYAGTTTVSLHSNGTITGTSIVNSGSNNNYVLLGGGGTKALSDFLYKSGGTMTGQLYINLDQDVALNQNGSLIIGSKGGENLAFDGNEIMARNNSAASTLYLNAEGGPVYIGSGGINSIGTIYQNGTKVSVEGHTHDYITSLGNKDASDLSSTYPNGLSVAGIYNNGYPFTFGSTITAKGNGGYFQIAGQWNSAVSSLTDYDYPTELYIRGRRDSYDVWTTWTRVLTNRNWSSVITLPTKSSWNYDDRYSFSHLAAFAFNIEHNSNYVTFDGAQLAGAPNNSWYNGFVSTHNNYLSSYLVNEHRTSNWYVGYSETTTAPTWYKLIHSGNYTNYTVTKTGSGASGTWGINISGNASTATKATQDSDGHAINSTYAKLASPNNLVHDSNEITMIPDSYNDVLWLNYQSVGRNSSANVTGYVFGNGKGGQLARITNGQFSGNAATATNAGSAAALFTNNSSQAADACYDATPGLHFYRFNGTGNTIGGGDGFIMQWSWNTGSVGGQIYMDDNPSGILGIRGCTGSSGTTPTGFTDWWRIYSDNYHPNADNATNANRLKVYTENSNGTYRVIGQQTLNAGWDNKGLVLAVASRHSGIGIYTIHYGAEISNGYYADRNQSYTDTYYTFANAYCRIRYFGDTFDTNDTKIICHVKPASGDNPKSAVFTFFLHSHDGSNPRISILQDWNNPFELITNGATMSTIDTSVYGQLKETTIMNESNSCTGNSATATKATQDSDGNTIKSTYLKKSGGTMTGTINCVSNYYAAEGKSGINMNNSDIVGCNSIRFGDLSDDYTEALMFYRSNGNWDSFRAKDGTFYFGVNNGTEYTAIHSGNYTSYCATSGHNHDSTYAKLGAHNNLTASDNEFTFASSGFSGDIYLNWRTAGGMNGNITRYILGNGKGGSLGTIIHTGNIGSQSVASAAKLTTARTLWGQSFDGTANVSGAITGATTISASSNVSIGGTLGVTGTTTLKSTTTIEANTYISGETFFSAADAFRLNYDSYGVIHRNDGGSYWILLTDKNNQNGGFNSLRPFHIDLSTGTVYMDNNAIIDNLAFTQCNISMGGRVNATWGYDLNTSDYYGLYFKSKNSSSTGILFNDDGNVGIGTTSPLRKLHVIGEAIFGESGYVATQGTGSGYSGTWVGTGFMELSAPNPYIDFHANKSTADFTSRLIQWNDKVRLEYVNSNSAYNGYILTCEGNHHNPVILGIFDLKRSGPGSTIWTLDNICGPCVFTLANNWGSNVTSNSNTYWTIPSNLLRVEINGILGDNYATKTTVKAAACIGTVMTRWMNNQPVVSNRSHEDIAGCSVECLCTDKAPGTNLYYDSNSPGKYIYITGAKPYGYDEGTNGLSMDQFRSTGHLSYLRVRFVVYGWLE